MKLVILTTQNIKNLKMAIGNTNYPSNGNTKIALKKYEDKLDVMKKSPKFKK